MSKAKSKQEYLQTHLSRVLQELCPSGKCARSNPFAATFGVKRGGPLGGRASCRVDAGLRCRDRLELFSQGRKRLPGDETHAVGVEHRTLRV
jgi:hypothetical protein